MRERRSYAEREILGYHHAETTAVGDLIVVSVDEHAVAFKESRQVERRERTAFSGGIARHAATTKGEVANRVDPFEDDGRAVMPAFGDDVGPNAAAATHDNRKMVGCRVAGEEWRGETGRFNAEPCRQTEQRAPHL